MWVRYILHYTASLLLYVAGFPIVFALDLCTPRKETAKWPILDFIYGNKVDGLDGDPAYRLRVPSPHFRRFRWCQLRNPLNNWLRKVGPCGVVTDIRHSEKGLLKLTRAWIGGRQYFFAKIIISRSWELWFGYRLFRDDRTDSRLQVGHHLENTMLLWPVKKVG